MDKTVVGLLDYDTQKEDTYTTSKAVLELIYAFLTIKKNPITYWRLRILYEENKKD